jgi:hypothetical protein
VSRLAAGRFDGSLELYGVAQLEQKAAQVAAR